MGRAFSAPSAQSLKGRYGPSTTRHSRKTKPLSRPKKNVATMKAAKK